MAGLMIGRRAAAVAATLAVVTVLSGCANSSSSSTATPPLPHRPKVANVVNYRITHPEYLTQNHRYGHIQYPTSPPVGGDYNPYFQDCDGEIYGQPIANEHAVHSLDNGAVWITYRPDLPGDQIRTLEALTRDQPYLMMSPYPGLDAPISLQAWGYQLKVDTADNPSVAQFIRAYRMTAAMDPSASCAGGLTVTGTEVMLGP